MTAVIAFISAIPSMLAMLQEIIAGVKAVTGFIQENKNEAWFQESAKVFTDLRSAKTPEEKKLAAQKIRNLLAGV